MKRFLILIPAALLVAGLAILAQAPGDSLLDGYKLVEVSSVADAMEQLYGERA